MVDIVDKVTRSRMMSGIRSSNTNPEILTRKSLFNLGYRYQFNSKIGKIKPDIVLRKHKVAIFVHGCYWHQHKDCKLAYSAREYSEKWQKKFDTNLQRDKRVTEQLLNEGWRVAVIWECVTREKSVFNKTIQKLNNWIQSQNSQFFESDYKKP